MRKVGMLQVAMLLVLVAVADASAQQEVASVGRKMAVVTTVTTVETGQSMIMAGPVVTYRGPSLDACNEIVQRIATERTRSDRRFKIDSRCEWR